MLGPEGTVGLPPAPQPDVGLRDGAAFAMHSPGALSRGGPCTSEESARLCWWMLLQACEIALGSAEGFPDNTLARDSTLW